MHCNADGALCSADEVESFRAEFAQAFVEVRAMMGGLDGVRPGEVPCLLK